jgi:predicted nucleotidyltransferase
MALIDSLTLQAVASFREILTAKYGTHLRAVYLFGSRARGDYRQDSDLDVAVFLDEARDPIGEQFDLIARGYDIVLSTGINIQPWVFAQASWDDPDLHPAKHLVETIHREGIPL